jgi:hypothetical protein
MRVTASEDVLGLSSRLVFSAHRGGATAPRAVTLTNTGLMPIRVSGLLLSGQDKGQFGLAPGQPTSFSIAAGRSAQVRARFRPTAPGAKFASLVIVNDSRSPRYVVKLRGIRARGTVGDTEPQLAQLLPVFGYFTDVGFTAGHQATTRALRGDEVRAPYFVRADRSAPVRMVPIARYTAATSSAADNGRTPFNRAARSSLYRFARDPVVDTSPGDGVDSSVYAENQKTFPSISSGLLRFSPSAAFGVYANFNNYSDDRFNRASNGAAVHNIRVYPAKGPGGARLPNAWILAVDTKVDAADKNYDYQDQIILLLNARPA